MNAYFASFMLLLFNAVGLAMPASAAAAERMVPELGSTANLSESSIADQHSVIETAKTGASDYRFCALAECLIPVPLALNKADSKQQAWAVVAMRSEAGDKLEHEEGAP
ncbi:hypothetical protein [Parasphingorhabdus sp.]|uniref:hypothetical protein n=1 Tax=Parasphingorhabdus sp. TaxID=2709688 RepID=UPI003A93CB99